MQETALDALRRRIPPVRGLIFTHNSKGKALAPIDLKRWICLSRSVYQTPKIDVHSDCFNSGLLLDLLDSAKAVDTRLSARTACTAPPEDLGALKQAGLFDVCLAPESPTTAHFDKWLDACHQAQLPIRLQLLVPFDMKLDPAQFATRAKQAGLVAANIGLDSPFLQRTNGSNGSNSSEKLRKINAVAAALVAAGVDVNILDLPYCMVDENLRAHVLNSQQVFQDHQQYRQRAYELAITLYQKHPRTASKIIGMLLGRYTVQRSHVDEKLLPWLLKHPWFYIRTVALHKLTRHWPFPKQKNEIAPADYEAREKELLTGQKKTQDSLNPVCRSCSLVRICDKITPAVERALPGIPPVAQSGETVYSHFQLDHDRTRFYDSIDEARGAFSDQHIALARKTNDITTNRPPDLRITPFEYTGETTKCYQFEGAVKWLAITSTEHLSTPIAKITPPCTVSVTFGGGMADYIGFSFGRQAKIVCPMEACRHTLTLHIEPDGNYVLLRDGLLVRPCDFEGSLYAPKHLGSELELRLSLMRIDNTIMSQFVDIWQDKTSGKSDSVRAKYSVVIVCSRYARRLQAALRCLAHQEDFDLRKLEVIVSYIPGLDATDDLIASMQMTYPDLRILRSPFPEQSANAKGFIINESRRMASGDWIVLLDSDILVPPRMFAEIEKVEKDTNFIASDGRKMLTPEVTARVLLGEIDPWRQWEELMNGPGEHRLREAYGVPIGFFQCVRAECMEKVQYEEMDHFEGADMRFGIGIWDTFGAPVRLLGYPVLHMDHGGSQWYGTTIHR